VDWNPDIVDDLKLNLPAEGLKTLQIQIAKSGDAHLPPVSLPK